MTTLPVEAAQLPKTYPIQLGLAYLLLVGYAVRTLFVSFSLPASVGVIISGWIFSYFIQDDIFFGRDMLQELSFFLVLLTAGLGISLPSLKWQHFVVALLPCTLELLAITGYATTYLGYTFAEGLNLGTVLVAVGDGLVIPKMKEFNTKFPEHPMPYLMLCWAPVEACYVLALFGVFTGVSSPASRPDVNLVVQISWTLLRLFSTISGGAIMGYAAGYAIRYRGELSYDGRPVFDQGSTVESFLILLGVALIAYGLGGSELSILGMGPLFHPELMVIVTGSTFAWYCDTHKEEEDPYSEVLYQVDKAMGGVWIFGQLVLFTMIGSKTSFSIFGSDVITVLPIMAVGLLVRFVGVMASILPMDLAVFKVPGSSGHPDGADMGRASPQDALFCFLACLPRATIQGALGAVPVNQRFFQDVPVADRAEAREFIFTAARLYIFCYAIFGMFLLNIYGYRILENDGRYARSLAPSPLVDEKMRAATVDSGSPASPLASVMEHKVVRVESGPIPSAGRPEVPPSKRKEKLRRSNSNVSALSGKSNKSNYQVIPDSPLPERADDPDFGVEQRQMSSSSMLLSAAKQNVSDPGPKRDRCVTEPVAMQKTSSVFQRMALYPFDERPAPVVAARQTSPADPRPKRRRSVGDGPREDEGNEASLQMELERGIASRGVRSHTWDASTNADAFRSH